MFQCVRFFLIFAFFCLIFSSLPLLLDIFMPKNGPPDEVLGFKAVMSWPDSLKTLTSLN